MDSKSLKLPYFFAVLNAVIIGLSFLFAKQALDDASPLDTLTFRFAASFLVMSVPVAFGWVKLAYRGKPWPKLLPLAAMYPLGFFTLQAYGLQHATSAEGGILYAFTPIVTMIVASVFLKEMTTLLQKLSIFVSVFGVVFIFLMKGGGIDWSNLTGITLLLLTCVIFAGYTTMARSLTKQFSPAEITYIMMAIGFAVFLIISFAGHAAAGTLHRFFVPLSSSTFVVSVLYLGIVSSLVTALTSNYILSKMEASKMSVFANLSTIVSMAAGAIVLGEELTVYHLIGSLLIIAGVVGANRLGRKKAAESMVQGKRAEA
ncbi:Threonine/homoserine efflux transporter RhtA [Paenibacillus sp. UNCCL117]|uniref:DMT family transporter n=1 Tax=unclassified Paenibacillus TaxID=185978 RepID=UPI000882F457|nr:MULTISPECIES: DMT family transporter [unclassified Paenibacillus]SDE23011.1 Threonine/homoserine efflux transporter RhtA [Paenibacillus sp. cl123]SFW42751.1 Threonine/homoserine efflux transporter RhtA [Paenibacillus sp. UNCCL117]